MKALEQAVEAPDDAQQSPCTSVGRLLASLGRVSMRRFSAALEPAGLKPRHLDALLALRAGPITQQGLAEAIRVDSVQLVGLLNDLETEALIERRRDQTDRRRHIVGIAPKGAARLAALDAAGAEIDAGLLAGLEASERILLRGLLLRVSQNADDEPAGEACPTA
jgi:DNA-binding MarR family transcriptional regulator